MPLRPLEPVQEEQSKLSSTAMRDTRQDKNVISQQFINTYFFFKASNSLQCHGILNIKCSERKIRL